MTSPDYTPPASSPKHHSAHAQSHSGLALVSMILGIMSIVTFTGLLLGIPAIVLGVMALKRKVGEKGMSIAGIITGAISTLASLVALGFFIMLMMFVAADYEEDRRYEEQRSTEYNQQSNSSSEL